MKTMFPDYAKKLGIPEEHVEMIITSYMNHTKAALSEMRHPSISAYMGTFHIIVPKVADEIEYLENRKNMRSLYPSQVEKLTSFKAVFEKYMKIRGDAIEKSKVKKQYYIDKKAKENGSKGETTQSLGKQDADSGGIL